MPKPPHGPARSRNRCPRRPGGPVEESAHRPPANDSFQENIEDDGVVTMENDSDEVQMDRRESNPRPMPQQDRTPAPPQQSHQDRAPNRPRVPAGPGGPPAPSGHGGSGPDAETNERYEKIKRGD